MKTIIYSILIATLCLNSGCSDFLDREPQTTLSPGTFWKTELDLKLVLNTLYKNMSRSYALDNQSVDCFAAVGNHTSSGSLTASNTDDIWTKSYKQIRIINDFMENYEKAQVTESVKKRYLGEARFFKAYYYFNLIKRFGDVPYITGTLDMESPELWGPRVDKKKILDDLLQELALAENDVPVQSAIPTDLGRITKGTIQALTARIALYYGTYYKFRNEEGYQPYLTIARDAAKRLIDSREYSIYKDYRNLFLLPGEDSPEHILSYRYSETSNTHNVRIRSVLVDCDHEPTKALADAFLCKDGLPIGKSQYKTEYLPLGKEFENRDPRMALTIWKPGDSFLGSPFVPNLSNQTKTGYMFKKYGDEGAYSNIRSVIDEILIRYAEVLLIYAEATYELNDKIDDADLHISINEIRRRFDKSPDQLPNLTNSFVTTHGLDMREEIRRERRVELAAEALRYDDLIRWKIAETELPQDILGAKFDSKAYPNIVPGKDINLNKEGFIVVQSKNTRTFDANKDYLFPLPLRELSLNKKLKQNAGWD